MNVGSFIQGEFDMQQQKAVLKAIERAKEKEQELKDFNFCLSLLVCPNCASDLRRRERDESIIAAYVCESCGCVWT